MITLQKSIETYIRAKDGNRPFLIADAFTVDAELTMQVNTSEISFPATVQGAKAISDVLVSEFAQRYENVYTFCIGAPPAAEAAFSCDWLVCMSEKAPAWRVPVSADTSGSRRRIPDRSGNSVSR